MDAAVIVVDVGSATWGGDESISYLIETFQPEVLYGFDPGGKTTNTTVGKTRVITQRTVAWTYYGKVGFRVGGLVGKVEQGAREFPCIDLAAFILNLDGEIVLKMDAEGAEYTLLPHLVSRDTDLHLKLMLVEWHCEKCGLGGNGRHREGCTVDTDWWYERREAVESAVRCEIQEWNR